MEPLNSALAPTLLIVASKPSLATPWLAGFQAQGLQVAWVDPACMAPGQTLQESGAADLLALLHPEAWLLLEEEWLTPVLQSDQRRGRQTPVLVLIPPSELDRAPELLQAGAADVWSRELPMPLLVRRLEVQIQLRRHQRALAKQQGRDRIAAEAVIAPI